MTNDGERGEGGKRCPKFDDVICERPLSLKLSFVLSIYVQKTKSKKWRTKCPMPLPQGEEGRA